MNRPVIHRRQQARVDMAECYAYIGHYHEDAARRFREAAEETFKRLALMPQTGALYPVKDELLEGLCRAQIKNFSSYCVFYLPVDGGIEVVRVLHTARNLRAIMGYAGFRH